MRIGITGPSYQESSLPFDAQRSVNCYPAVNRYAENKDYAKALYAVPGLNLFATAGSGPGRARFTSSNGRSFVVAGSGLYELAADGTATLRGSLDQTSGNVTIAENTIQLAVCDGVSLYLLDYSNNNFRKMSHGDITFDIGSVAYHDGYFVISERGTGRFYLSGLNDGEVWDALDFATAENDPDNLVRVMSALGFLWLLGEYTIEVWSNVGASDFPFRRMAGGVIEKGVLAAGTVVEVDNSLILLGQDKVGRGIVYRLTGFTPERISTSPVEQKLKGLESGGQAIAHAYQQNGRWFWVLTDSSLETSWAYDLETKAWHERAHLNDEGEFEPSLIRDQSFAFGKQLAVDRRNGRVYEVSEEFYDNAGEVLCRDRITTHVVANGQRMTANKLQVTVESGVGLQGSDYDSDPQLLMRVSKDAGRTWGAWREAPIGKAGEYRKVVAFRQLGNSDIFTFQLRLTDPVKFSIVGADLT